MAEHLGDDHTEWFVDVYPKGVWFQRCLTVYWPPGLEVNLTGAVFIWLVGRWFKMASFYCYPVACVVKLVTAFIRDDGASVPGY